MTMFVVWVCISCLLVPVPSQADDPDDRGEAACRNDETNFDLMQVKQVLASKTFQHDTTSAWAEGATPAPTPACGGATLYASDMECTARAWDFGVMPTAAECAQLVLQQPACYGIFMFSSAIASWSCKCCAAGQSPEGSPHDLWDLYEAQPACPSNSTSMPTPSPTIWGAQLYASDMECTTQRLYVGVFPNVSKCAEAVAEKLSCGPIFMFSTIYLSWGCRCCTEDQTTEGSPHTSWDLYELLPEYWTPAPTPTPPPTPYPTKPEIPTLFPTPAPTPWADVCGEIVDGPCRDCVSSIDWWCSHWHWDKYCDALCCGPTENSEVGCEEECKDTQKCPPCQDMLAEGGEHWLDSKGHSCHDYSHYKWCSVLGMSEWDYSAGPYWPWSPESPYDFADPNGVSAFTACCTCGGGVGSTVPPSPPTPPPTKPSACVDDEHWHEAGDPVHNCKWVADDPFKRCSDKPNADGLFAWKLCQESCGLCDRPAPCKDDKEWYAKGDKAKDCQWVHYNMAIDDSTCNIACSADEPPYPAYLACPLACGSCPYPYTPVPTPPPTNFLPCEDDTHWHEVGVPAHNCFWTRRNPNLLCGDKPDVDGVKAWEVCKESCGLCHLTVPCSDNMKWHVAGNPTYDCQWVLQTMVRDSKTCDMAMSGGDFPQPAWMACPLVCGSCPWPPQVPTVTPKPAGPTPAPTAATTDAPSPVPTPAPPICGPPPDTTLTFLTVPVQAGATQIEVELDAIFGIGDEITIRWMPYLCETKTIVSFGTITVDSPLINSYPTGAEVWVTTYTPTPDPTDAPSPVSTPVTKPIEPGDKEIEVEDEDGLSEGDNVTICSHDGKCETNTICGFGTIILCDACSDSYPNATLTKVVPTPAPTAVVPTPAPTPGGTLPGDTPEPTEWIASVMDDPHVRNIAGEVFDINMPGQHVMFRLPRDATQRPLIELRAVMSANARTACGLYVRSVTLMGDWLDGHVVHVRAHKRNLPGNNNAGNATIWPFALKVSPANAADADKWRPFENFKTAGVGAFEADFEMLTDKVTVGALRREEYGNFLEAQAFEFHFGPDKLPAKTATLIVAQASHQALGIELAKVSQLGWLAQEVGGLLGSDKRDRKIEEFTRECKEEKSMHMVGIRDSREQTKAVLKATW